MATHPLREAINELNDELLFAGLLADSFSNLHYAIPATPAPLADEHAWVFVVAKTIERVRAAAEDVERVAQGYIDVPPPQCDSIAS